MAYARVSYTGDGSTKIFSVPFPYLDASYVEVRLAGTLKTVTTHYTWLTSSTIQFITAPIVGATVYLLRNTPKEARLVNYQDAAILREADLDLDSDQAFHIAQEVLDASVNSRAIETFVGGVNYTAGVTTTITLGDSNLEETTLLVLFDAAAQHQTEFTLAAGVITFNAPIPVGVAQIQVSYAVPLATGLIDGSVTTGKILDGSVTTPKLADGVFSGLTAVTPVDGDYVAIADTSDAGNKKKALISSLLSLILSTNAEALAGVVSTKAVTPAGLASGKSLAITGYMKLPGGLILQWGSFVASAAGYTTLTYPIAFTTGVYSVVGSINKDSATSIVALFNLSLGTTTGVPAAAVTSANAYAPEQIRWIAVGV